MALNRHIALGVAEGPGRVELHRSGADSPGRPQAPERKRSARCAIRSYATAVSSISRFKAGSNSMLAFQRHSSALRRNRSMDS
jgi:hypothetical protein